MIVDSRYWQWAELLYLLVLKELKVRYKRSIMGYLWAIANPFVFAIVYWIAFKFIMRVQMENYTIYILTGMFPWRWLSQAVTQGTECFTHNLSLVRRVAIPKLILPLSHVLEEMVHFIFAIPVILFFIVISGERLDLFDLLWQLPLLLILQACFIFPLTIIGGVCNVYVRDIQYLTGILFSVLFFITPMVYPLSMVPEQYQHYFKLNPAYWLIDSWHRIFSGQTLPLENLVNLLGIITLFSLLAVFVYQRLSTRIAELV